MERRSAVWALWLGYSIALAFSFFGEFLPLTHGGYASQRILLCLYLIAFALFGVWHITTHRYREPKAFWTLVLVAISASLFVLQPFFFESPFLWVEPVMFALFIMGSVYSGAAIQKLGDSVNLFIGFLVITVVAAFLYAGMTINYYLFSISDVDFDIGNIIPWGFFNIRYWSHTATWLVPIFPLALVVLPPEHRLWRFCVYFTAAIWVWVLLMSAARGTVISLSVGIVVVLFVFGRKALPWAKILGVFLMLGVGVWLFLSVLLPSLVFGELEIRNVSVTSSGRLTMWSEALRMSFQNMPWGMGPQSWLTHDLLTSSYADAPKLAHPHNMYLMWAAEYGWLAVLALALVGISGAKHLFAKRDVLRLEASSEKESHILVALTVSVVAGVVHAGLSAVFMAPVSMLLALFIFALFWSVILPPAATPDSVALGVSKLVPAIAALLLLLAISIAWLTSVFSYHWAMEKDLPDYHENVPGGLMPRFWLHGNFPRHPEPVSGPLNETGQ